MNTHIKQTNQYTLPKIQKSVFQAAIENDFAVAIWQLPAQEEQHLIVDLGEKNKKEKLILEESKPGFAASPFINDDLKHTYFIQADLHYTTQQEATEFLEDPLLETQPDLSNTIRKYLENPVLSTQKCRNSFNDIARNLNDSYNYRDKVSKAIGVIEDKKLRKVVMSRREAIEYPDNFDIIETFRLLCQKYSRAFCYAFHIPQVGTWMGASPETLIGVDANKLFETVSLAGTQALQPEKKLSQIAWTQKEIEEQALVSRYIINCFKKIRLREFEEEGPKTVAAGNLMHLKTTFKVDMKETSFPQLGSVMLDLLHPTSAVCGMPKDESLAFILQNENYEREFYSGFLGPVNIMNNSHLFVNLRCMQLTQKNIFLYAGAGITEDSIPEHEWEETRIKCKTMLDVLKNK